MVKETVFYDLLGVGYPQDSSLLLLAFDTGVP